MLEGGIPLLQGLKLVKVYAKKKKIAIFVSAVITDVERGADFSQALSRHVNTTHHLVVYVVQTGEQSGDLAGALMHLKRYLETKDAFVKKLRHAALMPAVTLIIAMAIITGLFVFVVPHIKPMLTSGDNVPLTTKIVLWISDFFESESQRGLAIGLLFFLFIAGRMLKKSCPGAFLKDWMGVKIPGVRSIVITANTVYFADTVSFLLNAGVSLQDAVTLGSNVCSNRLIAQKYQAIASSLEQGHMLSQACAAAGLTHPAQNMLIQSIAIGEEAGTLAPMMCKCARMLEARLNAHLHVITTLLQPLLIVTVGLIIAAIMLSLYLPLFNAAHLIS